MRLTKVFAKARAYLFENEPLTYPESIPAVTIRHDANGEWLTDAKGNVLFNDVPKMEKPIPFIRDLKSFQSMRWVPIFGESL